MVLVKIVRPERLNRTRPMHASPPLSVVLSSMYMMRGFIDHPSSLQPARRTLDPDARAPPHTRTAVTPAPRRADHSTVPRRPSSRVRMGS